MRTLKLNDHETLCVPDVDGCAKLATYDTCGWINIGLIGDSEILVSKEEWPAFVTFINELDQHMLITTSGAYQAPESDE